jgi:YVTN family beta-propeller protein
MVVTPDGRKAFVAAANADAIVVLDLEAGAVTGTLKAGQEPDGMAYVPVKVAR